MRIHLFVLVFLVMTVPANAQVQLSVGVGISSSVNMGEIGPAPIFKSTFIVGDKFKIENNFEFSSMDKYTEVGWFVSDGINVLVFSSDSGLFVVGGIDYRHRNGGLWAKDGIRIGGGVGYEKNNYQIRFSVKDKIISLNDDVKYYPYLEFLVRKDTSLNDSWSLRTEIEIGSFQYVQNNSKSMALYLNTVLGLVYKWQ